MAEKGNLIRPQSGGKYIGMCDAVETDDLSNSRLIQLADISTDKIPSPRGTATRAGVTAQDGEDLSALPAGVTNNLITCGDASRLIVFSEFASYLASQQVYLVPLVFDDEVTPYVSSILEGGYLHASDYYTGAGPSNYIGDSLSWDITGASRIGLLLPWVDIGSSVSLWGFVI